MSSRKIGALFVMSILILISLACNALLPQPEAARTQITEPVSRPSQEGLPQTDAEVPRVGLEEAKAAFDSGQAVIVDVRSAAAYAESHVAGAINIQLGEIETNPTGLNLDQDQWIITYCT